MHSPNSINDRSGGGLRIDWLRRHPMVQFGIVAAALFALHAVVAPPAGDDAITIESADVATMVTEREEIIGRPLTSIERDQLVEIMVEHEVLVREAFALGLERDDSEIQHRLANKMLFLIDTEPPEPTSDELETMFREHADRYRLGEAVTLEQVFYRDLTPRIDADLERLTTGDDAASLGEPFWLGSTLSSVTREELASVFGADFASAVFESTETSWWGPVASARGLHLIRVVERFPAKLPPIEAVADRLRRDWQLAYRQRVRRERIGELRRRYTVAINTQPELSL